MHQTVRKRRALIACLVAVTLLFSYWTYERNKIWKDELSLWADIYKKSPDKARVNQHFGSALFNANRLDEAIPIYEKALRNYVEETKLQKNVNSVKIAFHLINLGLAYKEKGLYKKAILFFNRALEAFYFDSRAHYNLGLCYAQTWRLEKAVYHFSKALEFSKHHSTEIGMQASEANIKSSLAKAKMSLKEQKKRELIKKINK
jgi:tetratricopeptide (TPR) repeat protein